MKRRFLSILLALCMLTGLLPVVAYAATPADVPIKIGGTSFKLTGYDSPVYTVNTSKQTQDTAGNAFTKWGQTATGANADNWNAKYEWKTGDPGPTLTLRGFKMDEWNNETGRLEAKITDGEYTTTGLSTYAITADADAPLTIVIAEDSLIETKFGITFKNDTTIRSDNNATLTIHGYSSCIASNNTAGADLTVDANLDLSVATYYNTAYGGAVMHTYQADLTINGGNIRCAVENLDAKSVKGIGTQSSGDLTINGGNVTTQTVNSKNATNASVSAAGKLLINGGTVTANSVNGVAFYGKDGIEIQGGTVNAISQSLYGFNAGADIVITGGTVESQGTDAFYVIPSLGANMGGFAGNSPEDADYYNETMYRSDWVKLSETEPTQPVEPAPGEVAVKPYYGIGSSDFNRVKFPNLEGRLTVLVNVNTETREVYLSADGVGRDVNKLAAYLKAALDRFPEGMRTIVLHNVSNVFQLQEDTVYFDEGVEKLRVAFAEFIKTYAQIGGKLDGIVLDVEYVDTHSWYLYSKQYTKENPDVYKNIVANPRYETEIRPLLVERGFKFYEENAEKSEIYSIYPRFKETTAEKYAVSQTVWDTVTRIRLNNYMTTAVYEPLAQYMPDVALYDYQSRNTYAWLKDLSDKGGHTYVAGNSVAVGVTSHHNSYGSRLHSEFFTVDGQAVYKKPVAYNGAEFAATPFNRILWDVNLMKNMYEASGGNISITVAEYDYSPSKVGTPSNTPYYTEAVLHMGLLDPNPFNIYMYDKEFTDEEYNQRAQVLQDIMAELTRVAGFADREPISVPAEWNSSFLLSGIYANGRNLWRLTPDTTQVSLDAFQIAGSDPTFCVNGQTITFPQGKIIADGEISEVGTCGYWIETPKNVKPVITTDVDRYSKYPAFSEDFSDFAADPTWEISGDTPVVENGALTLVGTATLNHIKLPQNITAGDYYAKEQAWEISVTLQDLDGELILLACGDGGFKLAGGKAYYDANGTYQELANLTAGEKYTLKRELNFDTCTYSIYAGDKLIAQAADVKMQTVSLPVEAITFSCRDLNQAALLDDYKLYPIGLTADLEIYNANSGMPAEDTFNTEEQVAYRLSWMNATDTAVKRNLRVARYDEEGNLVSDTLLASVDMQPGCDGVETGIVENTTGWLTIYLDTCDHANTTTTEAILSDATCTEVGFKQIVVTCECGEVISEELVEINTVDHEWTYVPGKDATCTESGLTEGEYCALCGEVSVEQEEIEPNGEHTYDHDFDAICNVCGEERELAGTFKFENYRVIFFDSDNTHKNVRIEVYELGDKTIADPTDEKALKAIDASPETVWGASRINKILITDAGNYVLLLKYNVGTSVVKVPMELHITADPKLIIDKNNKITAIDDSTENINHRVVVYFLGENTVKDIYDEAALLAIDAEPETVWQMSRINRLALTRGGNYVIHLCYNKPGSNKITVAQQFAVFAIPSVSVNNNNMLVAVEENPENRNHRATVFFLGEGTVDDPFDEEEVNAAAITSKTYWGLPAINKVELKAGGNYVIHLYYNVGTSEKRTLALDLTLNERPALEVDENGKITVSYSDPEINNPRAYIYKVGDAEVADIYDEAALKKIATPTQVWGLSSINKKTLEPGTYVVHFYYSIGTSAKKTVALKVTI